MPLTPQGDPDGYVLEREVRETPAGIELTLRGEIDMSTAPSLLQECRALLCQPRTQALIVDMAGVSFMDSSGISALIEARRLALERRAQFKLRAVPEQARTALAITGVADLFDTCDS
jgi:anti-sigma B factor antagonist